MGMQADRYMVAGYPFDGTANDIMGVNNGTVNGATFVDGKIGKAASFDGVDDNIVIVNNSPFEIQEFSISLRLFSIQNNNYFIQKGFRHFTSSNFSYQAFVNSSNKVVWRLLLSSTSTNVAFTEIVSSDNAISGDHVVLTFNNGTARIYINCKLNAEHIGIIPIGYNMAISKLLYIGYGKNNVNHAYFKGAIDSFIFRNKELTQQEIQRDYLNLPIF